METQNLEVGKVYYFDAYKNTYGTYVGAEEEDGVIYVMFKPIVNGVYATHNGYVEFGLEDKFIEKTDNDDN